MCKRSKNIFLQSNHTFFSFGDLPSALIPFKLSYKFNSSNGDGKVKNFSAAGAQGHVTFEGSWCLVWNSLRTQNFTEDFQNLTCCSVTGTGIKQHPSSISKPAFFNQGLSEKRELLSPGCEICHESCVHWFGIFVGSNIFCQVEHE